MILPQRPKCRLCKRQINYDKARQCSGCDGIGGSRPYFCTQRCSEVNCSADPCADHETCWTSHFNPRLASDHQPIDACAQIFAWAATCSESDTDEQRRIHEQEATARWFDIDLTVQDPRLRVYDRLSRLCDPKGLGNSDNSKRYPTFVSFIGQTCVGKSSLVRAMLLLEMMDQRRHLLRVRTNGGTEIEHSAERLISLLTSNFVAPVTRSEKTEDIRRPTTQGVQLYGKTSTMHWPIDGPLFLADCEGFRGGIEVTNSEKYKNNSPQTNGSTRDSSPASRSYFNEQPEADGSSEEIPSLLTVLSDKEIKAKSYSRHGKTGVELFYARFLYAVSDVIVFVTKDDTTISKDLTNLFEWAASAVFKSINNPSQKTLIIVRNMASPYNKDLNEENTLREAYLKDLKPLWEDSHELRNFVSNYNNAQYPHVNRLIQNNEDLFNLLFPTRRFCNIPKIVDVRTQPEELFEQYKKLRLQILESSQTSMNTRAGKSWTRTNIPKMIRIVHRAFEHFRTSDEPFDFYEAVGSDIFNPSNTEEHLGSFLKLANACTRTSTNTYELIIEALSLSMVVRVLRSNRQDINPEEIFDREIRNLLDRSYRFYVENYQKCCYVFDNGEGCDKRLRSEHGNVHVSTISGQTRPGLYKSADSHNVYHAEGVEWKFKSFLGLLLTESNDNPSPPSSAHAQATNRLAEFRKTMFKKYREFWKVKKNNKTCLACLQAVPDHSLRCGHAYCARCVCELGQESSTFECSWDLKGCVLCSINYHEEENYHVMLKPRCAGVRILTLDGGGIRGVIELVFLQKLQKAIGLGDRVPIRALFDLIIGTSTGGIIALALATSKLSTEMIREEFKLIAQKTFTQPFQGRWIRYISPFRSTGKFLMAFRIVKSIYSTDPLRAGLVGFFGKEKKLFSTIQASGLPYATRVAVTAAKDSNANHCLIASYNRPDMQDCDDFEREEDESKDMAIWEAGLATSAAPYYFKPFLRAKTKTDYVDGALFANCPAQVALREKDKVWPNGEASLDMLLSIGTGIKSRKESVPHIVKVGGIDRVLATFFNNIDTESLWRDFTSSMTDLRIKDRLHRLNVPIRDDISLDDCNEMDSLETLVNTRVSEDTNLASSIQQDASLLLASLFFFEPDEQKNLLPTTSFSSGPQSPQGDTLRGTIRCRLRFGSAELKALLGRVDGFWHSEMDKHSDVSESMSSRPWNELDGFAPLKMAVMANQESRFRLRHNITTADVNGATQVIAVRLRGESERIPISGFPATLRSLQRRAALY